MPNRTYQIFCDESSKHGPHYSNFYGGVLLAANDQQSIESALSDKKDFLKISAELKWTKVSENYLDKYISFIDLYFEFIASSKLKARVMFTQNFHKPIGLSSEQLENRYFILYYQLIKHAFGLSYCNPGNADNVNINVFLDDMPDTKAKLEIFKRHICNIYNTELFRDRNIYFPYDGITEIKSHNHCILQGLDIILGSMQFRLNDLHVAKPEGSQRRGNRTIAKEKLYKHINRKIREIYPGFNIGGTTGHNGDRANRWFHPYRHWLFVPREWEADHSFLKG